jgi:hypothetical protein
MKELADSMAEYVDAHNATGATVSNPILQQAANKWAAHSLETYQGKLLKRALAISAAISDFISQMET